MFSPARGALLMSLLLAGCGRFLFDESEKPDGGNAVDAFDCGHTFCDSFDRSGPPEESWDSITMTGGTMALVTDTAVSAPQSLLVTVPTDGTTLTGNAYLTKQLPMATTKVLIHVQMSYATAMTMNTEADLIALKWDTLPVGCTSFGFYLVRDGTKPLNLQETYVGTGVCSGGSVQNYTLDLDNNTFMDVTMEVTFGAQGTAHLTLIVGNMTLVDKAATQAVAPSTLTLEVGGGISRNGLTPWTFRYDDLTVDVN